MTQIDTLSGISKEILTVDRYTSAHYTSYTSNE